MRLSSQGSLLLAIANTAAGQLPSSSSTLAIEATATLFLPPEGAQNGLIATVIHADDCATTYGLVCTSGSWAGTAPMCAPSYTPIVTYYGSSVLLGSVSGVAGPATETFIETCTIDGTTKAVCSRTYGNSAYGQSTASTSITTLSGDQVVFAQVPITAGAQKLSGLTVTSCAPSSSSTSSGAAPAVVNNVYQRYRVLIVPGAMALLAGVAV